MPARRPRSAAAAAGLHVSGVVSVDETQAIASRTTRPRPLRGRPVRTQAVDVPVKRGTQQMSAQVTVVFAYTG